MKKALFFFLSLVVCITLCTVLAACNGAPQNTEEPTEAPTEFVCTDHVYKDWYTDTYPTCTADGLKKAECMFCDNYKTEVIPMTHDLTTHPAKEPTCSEIGWNEYQTCYNCDYTTYEELPKDHKTDENGACAFCGYTIIKTADDLKKVGLEGKYLLTDDINLLGAEWTPIGTKDAPFIGEFNGNGHVIKNYKITAYHEYLGFFGVISEYAKLEGFGVEEFNVDVSGTSQIIMAGGLVGFTTGESITIKNCHASGEMKVVTTCNNTSTDYNGACYVGGLIGYTEGSASVYYCYSDVKMSANADKYAALHIGGLAGYYYDWRIAECYSSSVVSATTTDTVIYIGGLLGSTAGAQQNKIQNCYTTGSVYAHSKDGYIHAGGIVGNGSALWCYSTCAVNASSENGDVHAGGIVGYTGTFISVSNCLSTGKVISSGYAGGASGMKEFTPGNDGYISTCYYIEPNADHIQGDKCETTGKKATVEEIKTEEFFTSAGSLQFDKAVWSFTDGELPTLKCFASTDTDAE